MRSRDRSSITTGTPVPQNYCVGGIFAEPRPQFHSRGLPFRKTSVVVWFLRSQDATITLTLTTKNEEVAIPFHSILFSIARLKLPHSILFSIYEQDLSCPTGFSLPLTSRVIAVSVPLTGTPVSQNYCVGGVFAEPGPQFHSRGLPFRKTSVVVGFLRSHMTLIFSPRRLQTNTFCSVGCNSILCPLCIFCPIGRDQVVVSLSRTKD